MNVLYLDINGQVKTTDYAIQRSFDGFNLLLVLHDGSRILDLDRSKFDKVDLEIIKGSSGQVISIIASKTIKHKDIEVVQFSSDEFNNENIITIIPTVYYDNQIYELEPFELQVFDDSSLPLGYTTNLIDQFNNLLHQHLSSIQYIEKGNPNGVVPLDENGIVDNNVLPESIEEHANRKIINNTIHRLKLDENNRLVYHHEDWDEWLIVNTVWGGRVGIPRENNKGIHGGFVGELRTGTPIHGGYFNE